MLKFVVQHPAKIYSEFRIYDLKRIDSDFAKPDWSKKQREEYFNEEIDKSIAYITELKLNEPNESEVRIFDGKRLWVRANGEDSWEVKGSDRIKIYKSKRLEQDGEEYYIYGIWFNGEGHWYRFYMDFEEAMNFETKLGPAEAVTTGRELGRYNLYALEKIKCHFDQDRSKKQRKKYMNAEIARTLPYTEVVHEFETNGEIIIDSKNKFRVRFSGEEWEVKDLDKMKVYRYLDKGFRKCEKSMLKCKKDLLKRNRIYGIWFAGDNHWYRFQLHFPHSMNFETDAFEIAGCLHRSRGDTKYPKLSWVTNLRFTTY